MAQVTRRFGNRGAVSQGGSGRVGGTAPGDTTAVADRRVGRAARPRGCFSRADRRPHHSEPARQMPVAAIANFHDETLCKFCRIAGLGKYCNGDHLYCRTLNL